MAPGQSGTVIGFTDDSRIARRLVEMGLVPGMSVTYLRRAPLNDPMQIQVGRCCLSLRHREASLVTVELDQ